MKPKEFLVSILLCVIFIGIYHYFTDFREKDIDEKTVKVKTADDATIKGGVNSLIVTTAEGKFINLAEVVSDAEMDLRYASNNNFVSKILYDCAECYVRPEMANALKKVAMDFSKMNLRIKLFDCYRPKTVQEELWKIVPDPNYVTPPDKGSMHNRALAVDLTLVDSNGFELDMGTEFDFFGEKAHHTSTNHSQSVLDNRKLLKNTMEKHGFQSIRTEWWHYSLKNVSAPIANWEWECE